MITYEMIYNASQGDYEAMNTIIAQYKPYINVLAAKKIIYGEKTYYSVDIDLQDLLISKIIDITLNFNPVPKIKEIE